MPDKRQKEHIEVATTALSAGNLQWRHVGEHAK